MSQKKQSILGFKAFPYDLLQNATQALRSQGRVNEPTLPANGGRESLERKIEKGSEEKNDKGMFKDGEKGKTKTKGARLVCQ